MHPRGDYSAEPAGHSLKNTRHLPLSQTTTWAEEVLPADEVVEVVVAGGNSCVCSLGATSILPASDAAPQQVP